MDTLNQFVIKYSHHTGTSLLYEYSLEWVLVVAIKVIILWLNLGWKLIYNQDDQKLF